MTSLAGSFLVARPVLKDPFFRQTVVLVLQHNDSGAFGLIVNRPAKIEELPFPVFAGGPCESEGLLMLHGHQEWLTDPEETAKREVAPGVFLGDAGCLGRVKDRDDTSDLRYRLFAGYAGWGPNQLEGEISSGAWAIVSATADLLFEIPSEEIWVRLMPSRIPEPSMN